MGTYDWMELQTLTNDIAAARARLAAARSTKDVGKARGLEEEIARAESQRDRLLAHITTNLVTADPPPSKPAKGAEPAAAAAVERTAAEAAPLELTQPAPPAEDARPAQVEALPEETAVPEAAAPEAETPPAGMPENSSEQLSPDTADRAVATGAAPPAPAPKAASADGGKNVWDQLKPSDIERAKQDLETRRVEMLARHEEELRGLATDQAQLDTLEQAITAFLQKFNAAEGAGVVKLNQERELRQQTAG